jgi:hypothetical protein
MKPNFITWLAYAFITSAIILALWYLYFGEYFSGDASRPDPSKAKDIQPFISGLVLPLLTLGSTLLVIANLQSNTIQNFSNNFFKLIDQHHKLVDNINSAVEGITSFEKPSKGREFFDDLANRIAIDFDTLAAPPIAAFEKPEPKPKFSSLVAKLLLNLLSSNQEIPAENEQAFQIDDRLKEKAIGKSGRELLVLIYDHYYHIHQSDLSHYFRNLYHIVGFVERASIRKKSKRTFLKMLRAQLSNYELLLLAYNGLHPYGEKFYPLIENYELLKNLNDEQRVPAGYEKRIVDTEILSVNYPHLKRQWQ